MANVRHSYRIPEFERDSNPRCVWVLMIPLRTRFQTCLKSYPYQLRGDFSIYPIYIFWNSISLFQSIRTWFLKTLPSALEAYNYKC